MIRKIIFLILLCCVSFIMMVHISGNTNPNNDIMIDESNQTEEVEKLLSVNETIVLSPIPVVSIPEYKFVNASPIVMYSVEDFLWVWVDDISTLPNKSTYQKRLVNISKLEKDVEEAPYQIWELKRDSFDCSNTAGVMVEHLNSRGWDAAIIVGDSKNSRSIHAFIIVERRVIVSSVSKRILYTGEGDLNFFINRWDIIGFYFSKEDAIKRSRWHSNEWDDWRI